MRANGAIRISSVPFVAALLFASIGVRAQTFVTGSDTIAANVTDGVVANGVAGTTLEISAEVSVSTNLPEAIAALEVRTPNGYTVTNGGFVNGGSLLSGDDAITFTGGGGTLVNDGTVTGGAVAVYLEDANGTLTFTNNEGGNIGIFPDDLLVSASFVGLQLEGSAEVSNAGLIGASEAVVFSRGGSLTNTGTINTALSGLPGSAIRATSTAATSVEITNAETGTIQGGGEGAVILAGDGDETVNNLAGGQITSTSTGVDFKDAGGELNNAGEIRATGADAFTIRMAGGKLTNEGSAALIRSENGSGILFSAAGEITNSGMISVVERGIEVMTGEVVSVVNAAGGEIISTQGVAVYFDQAGSTLENAGTIRTDGVEETVGMVTVPAPAAVEMAGGMLSNTSTITSTNGIGVDFSADGSISNTGTISGGTTAVTGKPGTTFALTNSGTLTGGTGGVVVFSGSGDSSFTNSGSASTASNVVAVQMGTGDDTFTNSGTVSSGNGASAAVTMGLGNDRVTLQTGTSITQDIDAGGGADDRLYLDGNGSFGADLLGFESLEVTGTGTSVWALSEALSVANTVAVTSGGLRLTGTLTTGGVSIASAGALYGATDSSVGIVAAQAGLVNDGLLVPGGVEGRIDVTGDYAQGATGALQVLVGPSDAGRLLASGSATLSGKIEVLSSGFTGDPINQVVLEVGSLAGQFDDPEDLPLLEVLVCYGLQTCPAPSVPGVDPAPSPGLNRVSVQLVQTANFEQVASTPNQKAVGSAVDAMLAAGVDDPALDALFDLSSLEGLDAALDQLTPEPLGASAQLAFENARWYTALLSDHLRDARLGLQVAERGAASGVELASLGGSGGSLFRFAPALAAPAAGVGSAPRSARQLGVWLPRASAYAVLSDLGSGGGTTGYEAVTGVLGLGAEQWARRDLLLGAEISAAYTDLQSDRNGSEFDAVSGRLAVYGSYERGPWYLDAVASYAYHWYDDTRRIRYGSGVTAVDAKADSDHGAHEVSDYLGTGLHFELEGWDFGPEVSFQYTALIEESYSESSAAGLGLDVRSRTEDSLSSRVGMRVSKPLRVDENNVVLPKLRVAWVHEWLDTSQDLAARFEVSPVGAFEVSSRSLARDAVVARVGLQAALAENLLVDVEYGVDAGRSDYLSQQVSVVFSGRF